MFIYREAPRSRYLTNVTLLMHIVFVRIGYIHIHSIRNNVIAFSSKKCHLYLVKCSDCAPQYRPPGQLGYFERIHTISRYPLRPHLSRMHLMHIYLRNRIIRRLHCRLRKHTLSISSIHSSLAFRRQCSWKETKRKERCKILSSFFQTQKSLIDFLML